MTLDFFFEVYDLNELEFNNVFIKNNVLYLDVNMPTHLDLIANGYRPELDVIINKIFVFNNVSIENFTFDKPYSLKLINKNNDSYIVEISNVNVTIPRQNIMIEK